MTQRPLAAMTLLFGCLAVLAVLLPWYAEYVVVDGVRQNLHTRSGLHEDFLGRYAMPLAAFGVIAIGWFTARPTGTSLSKLLLVASLIGFLGAAVCDVLDLTNEVKAMVGVKVTVERGFGMYVALVGAIVATLLTLITVKSPRTPQPGS